MVFRYEYSIGNTQGIYTKRETKDVVVSNIHKDVSQRGTSMYVLNCDIILAKSKDEKVVDRRVVYKTGKKKPRWLRLGIPCEVDAKLAEDGT